MLIAIHKNDGSFASKWIEYCKEKGINYILVNAYDNNIVGILKDVDVFLWHFQQSEPIDNIMAKQLLRALEDSGKVVFPNSKTAWHFDDKVAQKYLFESLNIEAANSHVFYDLKSLQTFAKKTSYPVVWKLKGGSGSRNVRLMKNEQELLAIGRRMLGRGIRDYDAWGGIKETFRRLKLGSTTPLNLLKAVAHLIIPVRYEKSRGKAWGYVYLQDFIPNNEADYRVIVIGNKAFAIKRYNRPGDFRASGSGYIEYEKEAFEADLIAHSFKLAKIFGSQVISFDFVYHNEKPVLIEISYGFRKEGYYPCPGYWTADLTFHEEEVQFWAWIIENCLDQARANEK